MNEPVTKSVNNLIREYWLETKSNVLIKPVKKKKKPSFTRHNGNRIKRLKKAWRRPKGTGTSTLKSPKIGYKRPESKRYRRASDGLFFRVINNENELLALSERKPFQVGVFSAVMGAKKKRVLLEKARRLSLPLYMPKKTK